MPRLRHSPILGATGRTPNPDDREDTELSELDDDLDLGDPAAGTSYGRGGKEPDDSGETVTKGEMRELLRELSANFDRKLADVISVIERNKPPTKRSPTTPKPVDTSQGDSLPVSLRLSL